MSLQNKNKYLVGFANSTNRYKLSAKSQKQLGRAARLCLNWNTVTTEYIQFKYLQSAIYCLNQKTYVGT